MSVANKGRFLTRHVGIDGNWTTIALENIYWDAIETICAQRRTTLSSLLCEIEHERGKNSRASAIRVFVLDYTMSVYAMNTVLPEAG